MPNINSSKYFGDKYLARDFFGNFSITLSFILVASILYPTSIGKLFSSLMNSVVEAKAVQSIAIASGIAIVLATIGHIAGTVYSSIRRLLRTIPWIMHRSGYDKYYRRVIPEIEELHRTYISEGWNLYTNPRRIGYGTKIGNIIAIIEKDYPEGYILIYRSYMFVSMLRNLAIYTGALFVYALVSHQTAHLYLYPIVYIVISICIHHAIRDAVRDEYNFITSMANRREGNGTRTRPIPEEDE